MPRTGREVLKNYEPGVRRNSFYIEEGVPKNKDSSYNDELTEGYRYYYDEKEDRLKTYEVIHPSIT